MAEHILDKQMRLTSNLGGDLQAAIRAKYGNLYDPRDFHGGNIGFTPEGNVIGFDAGMVQASEGYGQPDITRYTAAKPAGWGPREIAALERMGGPEEIRRALAEGLSSGASGGLPRDLLASADNYDAVDRNREFLGDLLARYGDQYAPPGSRPPAGYPGETTRRNINMIRRTREVDPRAARLDLEIMNPSMRRKVEAHLAGRADDALALPESPTPVAGRHAGDELLGALAMLGMGGGVGGGLYAYNQG